MNHQQEIEEISNEKLERNYESYINLQKMMGDLIEEASKHSRPSPETIKRLDESNKRLDELKNVIELHKQGHEKISTSLSEFKIILDVVKNDVSEIRAYQKEQNGRVFKNSDRINVLEKTDVELIEKLKNSIEKIDKFIKADGDANDKRENRIADIEKTILRWGGALMILTPIFTAIVSSLINKLL